MTGATVGRFAPSPTGYLHFGSLVAAVGSFLNARAQGGSWRIRLEDIDPPREVPGSARSILEDLDRLGFECDGDILYQSTRTAAYAAATEQLLAAGDAFHCGCSRADLPSSGVYPGTCREGLPPGKQPRSVRVRVEPTPVTFTDLRHGECSVNLAEDCGDFVIRRADGLPAYQLAVAVDDAYQGITEVVRGDDLLHATPRQVFLQRLLNLATPQYLHLPLATDETGRKLGKRFDADPVATRPPVDALRSALNFLGQDVPDADDLPSLWSAAIQRWDRQRLPAPS